MQEELTNRGHSIRETLGGLREGFVERRRTNRLLPVAADRVVDVPGTPGTLGVAPMRRMRRFGRLPSRRTSSPSTDSKRARLQVPFGVLTV